MIAIILAPQLDLLNRILETVPLTLHQWLICIVAALTAVVASEIRKAILRRREQAPRHPRQPAQWRLRLSRPRAER